MKKRILSLCLALCLIVGLLPAIAAAAELPDIASVGLAANGTNTTIGYLQADKGTIKYATLKTTSDHFLEDSQTTDEITDWVFKLDNKNGDVPTLYVNLNGKNYYNAENGMLASGNHNHDLNVVFVSDATITGKRAIAYGKGNLTISTANGAKLTANALRNGDGSGTGTSYAGIGATGTNFSLTLKDLNAYIEGQGGNTNGALYTASGALNVINSNIELVCSGKHNLSYATMIKGAISITNSAMSIEADGFALASTTSGDVTITDSSLAISSNNCVVNNGGNAILVQSGNLTITNSYVYAESVNKKENGTYHHTGAPVLKVATAGKAFSISNSTVIAKTATYLHGEGRTILGANLGITYDDNTRADWGGMVVHYSHVAPTVTNSTAVAVENRALEGDKFAAPSAEAAATALSSSFDWMYYAASPATTAQITIPALTAGTAASGTGWIYNGDILTLVGNYTFALPAGFDTNKIMNATGKAIITAPPTAATGLTYTGAAQNLLSAGGAALGADLVYSLSETGEYAATIPTATNAGTYKVWYKAANDTAAAGSVEVTIAAKAITITGATVADKKYDGTTAGTVTAVTFDGLVSGQTLVLGTDYTATAVYNSADVATANKAVVTVTLTNTNYTLATASYDKDATIAKGEQAKPTGVAATNETAENAKDGKLTGVTDKMEYKLSGATAYTAITGTEVANLAPGTYLVRFAATANQNASEDVSVVINDATHEHAYGEWIDCEDGENHKKECACGQDPVTEAHKWDEGTVTVEAEVGKKGVKTYTCTECDAKKAEDIPALTEEGKSPQTGDNTNLALFAVLAVLAFTGVAFIGKKKYMA